MWVKKVSGLDDKLKFNLLEQEQLKQLALERDNKIAEVDVHSRKKDDRISTVESELRQKVQGKQRHRFSPF